MDHQTFFRYYLPALEEALRHDHEWEGFSVKGPDYFYAGDEQFHHDLEAFIETHVDEIPLFDRAGLYVDAVSHCAASIDGIRVQDYKVMLCTEVGILKQSFGLR